MKKRKPATAARAKMLVKIKVEVAPNQAPRRMKPMVSKRATKQATVMPKALHKMKHSHKSHVAVSRGSTTSYRKIYNSRACYTTASMMLVKATSAKTMVFHMDWPKKPKATPKTMKHIAKKRMLF